MSIFRFQAVVDYEIDTGVASGLLAENGGVRSVSEWINKNNPIDEGDGGTFNASNLRDALGRHLAKESINQARQLTMSADPTTNQEQYAKENNND